MKLTKDSNVFKLFETIYKETQINSIIPVIIGPTSIGKTSLAIEISKILNAEIISIDSRQIYKNFKIGTGQPSREQLKSAKHHLVDILDSNEIITAFEYIKLVQSIYNETNKRIVIVCGSLLYLNCIINGIINIPSSSSKLKKEIEDKILKKGVKESYKELLKLDEIYTSRIHMNDIKKIIRGYEIIELTSTIPTEAYKKFKVTFKDIYKNFYIIKLNSTNTIVKNNIKERISLMFRSGWINEVKELLSDGVSINSHPMQSIGYRQIADLININKHKDEEKINEIKSVIYKQTWNYAKKQKTWMNNFEHNILLG